METPSGFLQFMVYKSNLILVLPICYGLLAGNKYLSHCQRTVVYLVLSEFGSPFVCFYRRYDGCNYRGNNMHCYSVTALWIRQQQNHPYCMCATTATLTFKWMTSLQKYAEIYLYKNLGSNQIKLYHRLPVVLAWQEGRLNFCLTMGWFMSGELLQLPLLHLGMNIWYYYQYWVTVWVEDAALLHHEETIFKQSELVLLNQATNWFWSYFCTLMVHTEDKFLPCISLLCKMCSAGHSFTRSVQILICLVFTDIFSLPVLLGPATFPSV